MLSMREKHQSYFNQLERRRSQEKQQQMQLIATQDKQMSPFNFTSSDPFLLAHHPYVTQRMQNAVEELNSTLRGSGHDVKHLEMQRHVEESIASLLAMESALLFSNTLSALQFLLSLYDAMKGEIFIDRHSAHRYAHIIEPLDCKARYFDHNHLDHLEILLNKHPSKHALILTESIFQLSGDRAPIHLLSSLAEKRGCLLCLDDSSASPTVGLKGMGLAAGKGGIDFALGQFGRDVGSFGAYLAMPKVLRDYLFTFGAMHAYNPTLPPAQLGAIQGLMHLIPSMHSEREELIAKRNFFRQELEKRGQRIDPLPPSHLLPLPCDHLSVQELSSRLADKGIYTYPLQSKYLPRHMGRLLFNLHLATSKSHLQQVLQALEEVMTPLRHLQRA